jgi:hypothetical protein
MIGLHVRRFASIVSVFALGALVAAAAASAKSYHLTSAVETFRIEHDGSVLATEALTFDFSGSFHGAFRLIPAAAGESIDHVQVSSDGVPYEPGADASVGSSGPPQSYGVMTTDTGWTQVAWHFDAQDSARTFVVSYRMHRFVRAYSDVGNLYLQVWGDQWPVRLDHLHAVVIFPGPATDADRAQGLLRVWGHPASVSGSVAIAGPDRVTIDATAIPRRQFVEVDTTFPRHLLTATGSVVVKPGAGLQQVVARERKIYSSPYGPSPYPVASPAGGGGTGLWVFGIFAILFFPFVLLARFFGFWRGSDMRHGVGYGGSFGGAAPSAGAAVAAEGAAAVGPGSRQAGRRERCAAPERRSCARASGNATTSSATAA